MWLRASTGILGGDAIASLALHGVWALELCEVGAGGGDITDEFTNSSTSACTNLMSTAGNCGAELPLVLTAGALERVGVTVALLTVR